MDIRRYQKRDIEKKEMKQRHTYNFKSSTPGQNGRHSADNIFKWIFVNEKFCISIHILLKFVPLGSIDYKSSLFQVLAWPWTGDKSLPEPMLIQFTDAYMQHEGEMSFI